MRLGCMQGMVSFLPGETEREIEIKIIDDDMAEPDVTLSVVLFDVVGDNIYIVQVRDWGCRGGA